MITEPRKGDSSTIKWLRETYRFRRSGIPYCQGQGLGWACCIGCRRTVVSAWTTLSAPRNDHCRVRSARLRDSISCRILICSIGSRLIVLSSTDLVAISFPIVSLSITQVSFQARLTPLGNTKSYSYHEGNDLPLTTARVYKGRTSASKASELDR